MIWLAVVVVGLMVLAVGAQEVRTGLPAFRRPGAGRRSATRAGRGFVALGSGLALYGLSRALGFPRWVDALVILVVFTIGAWFVATHRLP